MTVNADECSCCGLRQPCGPCLSCRADQIYSLRANDSDIIGIGTVLGEIRKLYPGCLCKDPDHYVLKFPLDLDVKMKAVLLCGAFYLKNAGL